MKCDNERCCGTCQWHQSDDDDWVCTNEQSVYFTDWTDYTDCCREWEAR